MIDTLKLAKNSETAGFAKPQAEALTTAMAEMASVARDYLATKADLRVLAAELKSEISTVNSSPRTQILWALFGSQLFLITALAALSKLTELFK